MNICNRALACVTLVSTLFTTSAAFGDASLANRAEVLFSCSSVAPTERHAARLLLEGMTSGRQFFSYLDPQRPYIADVEVLNTSLFVSVSLFQFAVTGSVDFALGAVYTSVRRNDRDKIDALVTNHELDPARVKAILYEERECEAYLR